MSDIAGLIAKLEQASADIWQPASFMLATNALVPTEVAGYVYRGLGIHMAIGPSPKGRRPPKWRLTHLSTGHAIAQISGFVADALPIASRIAECGDWSFGDLDGWRNMDPELPAKVAAIAKAEPRCEFRRGGGRLRAVAQSIAFAREALPNTPIPE